MSRDAGRPIASERAPLLVTISARLKARLRVGTACPDGPVRSGLRGRLESMRAASREPLHRTGNALIANSAVTALLGVVFWAAAARSYSQSDLGLNSTAISAMMMIAGFSQLNLMSAMVRFLPTAGGAAIRLVGVGYTVAAIIATLAASAFVIGVDAWLPALAGFFVSWPIVVWFVASTALWTVFVLQDSILTGLGRPEWVPAENAVHSLTKLALVIGLAAAFPRQGVFLSWTAAVPVAAIPVNLLLFTRLLRRHAGQARPGDGLPPAKQIGRFVFGDYATATCWVLAMTVPAQLVLRSEGANAAATFAIAWVVGSSLYALPAAVGQGLVVQGAREPSRLPHLRAKAFRHTFRVLVPAAAVTLITAPLILRVFGESYSVQGSTELRLLALSAIPNAVIALTVSELRVHRRVFAAFCLTFSSVSLVLALTWLLLPPFGIAAVGIAWLIAQSSVAGVLILVRSRRRGMPSSSVSFASSQD